ncbi:MAG: diaminopimelate epimerase [Lentisphaeria bacterium]|nr:diaminopimelate epimerase [Lentisphaeria bacterium]
MRFLKYHGLGNDFVIVNADAENGVNFAGIARKICDRHFGVGADGLVLVGSLGKNSYEMRIFNSDGTECEMCGNATRCVTKYLNCDGMIELHTKAGVIRPQLLTDGRVRVDMGEPGIGRQNVPLNGYEGNNISMGNPHFVIFVEDVGKIDLSCDGAKLEINPYFPNKSNIEFVQVLTPGKLRMRVWERGCGITMACGTGSCAALVAGVLNNRCKRNAELELDGGMLYIEWNETDNHVYMTGGATKVFEGDYYV